MVLLPLSVCVLKVAVVVRLDCARVRLVSSCPNRDTTTLGQYPSDALDSPTAEQIEMNREIVGKDGE